jgi:hypothetical protein
MMLAKIEKASSATLSNPDWAVSARSSLTRQDTAKVPPMVTRFRPILPFDTAHSLVGKSGDQAHMLQLTKPELKPS